MITRVLLAEGRLEHIDQNIPYGTIDSGAIHAKAMLDGMHHRRKLSRKSAVEGAVKCVKKVTDLIEVGHSKVGVDYVAITTKEDIEVNFAKLEGRDRVGSFKRVSLSQAKPSRSDNSD